MFHVPEANRIIKGPLKSTPDSKNNGAFVFKSPIDNALLFVIASDQLGWEHVSVSRKNRCPNWPEMCCIKDVFWDEEDLVAQYHPPKSEYVNNHPHCLHLWRPTKGKLIYPQSILVGVKEEMEKEDVKDS